MLVGFEIFAFTIDDLITVILSGFNNVQGVSHLTFIDDGLVSLGVLFLHGVDEGLFILVVDVLEQD
jgi:hypothetical protein